MRYGFVIDQRTCIGCHACTVACKEEHRVPLGVFRTWVKYVERGTFPSVRRYFTVLRCNHCEHAPCVAICPTVALRRRPDGIVDFDRDRCIGCKGCMQACPYDALYIDPETATAAKCNYCAHRVEAGLEPACVTVCPQQAIVAGDLDDPGSRIARLVATEQVQVRKPGHGTGPRVFYLGADGSALSPSLQAPAERYVWAERPREELDLVRMAAAAQAADGVEARTLSRPVYDAPHQPRPWGWKVSAYLWTKSVAAGALAVAALGLLLGAGDAWLAGMAPPVLALVALAATTALLVADLRRPERFLYILLRPNRDSWLVWGGWILLAYGLGASAWLAASVAGSGGGLAALALPVSGLAVAAAGYSALLFRQARGRDLWQSPLLLPHLVAAAAVAGAAGLLLVAAATGGSAGTRELLARVLAASLAAHGLLLAAELWGGHPTVDARRAARLISRGPWRRRFWGVVVTAGTLLPLLLVWAGGAGAALASALALVGLWVWEDLWVKAGQSLPLS